MAAIKPHLAQPNENTELEDRYWQCLSEGRDGLGRMTPDHEEEHKVLCPTPGAVLDQTHAGLMQVVYTRKVLLDDLEGVAITPGYKGRDVALYVDKAITGPTWNPMLEVETTSLLSWTTKMQTPSFSLPAGAPVMGGACPGAMAGQSVVPDADRRTQALRLLPVLYGDDWRRHRIDLANTICEHCYAEGGQYATGSVQYHQLVRFAWARRAVRIDMNGEPTDRIEDSALVNVMIDAIDRVDFKESGEPTKFGHVRFFRIHDSGDFFNSLYLQAWKAVANHYHPENTSDPIVFWAPSRVWAEGIDKVRQVERINGPVNGVDTNLIIRPSAYETNAQGPDLFQSEQDGWASASTVYADKVKEEALGKTYDWDCRAYAVDAPKHSCRDAIGPADETGAEGTRGCRACWIFPNLRVNYTLHTR